MMATPSTGLTIFEQTGAALPAHTTRFFEEAGSNIAPRTTVPSLSPEGKTWTLSINGQKTKLQRRNSDGDLEPMPIMKAVILDYNKNRGRAYYEGEYDPNNVSAPICWSDDGMRPDDSLPGPFPAGTAIQPGTSRKISDACASCPMAVKGSKVIAGTNKAITACAQHRMLALVPDPALGLKDIPPLRLKIAMTSDWDGLSPDQEQQGWLAFKNYTEWLAARGCKHTAAIVTKMKFDPDAAYPKIFFSAERPLEENELAVIAPLAKSDEVKKLLGGTWTPAGVDGVPKDQQPIAQPEAGGAAPSAPPAPQYVMADGEEFTLEQYRASGWTDDQLIAAGKLIAQAPPAEEPAVEMTPAPPPAPAAAPAPAQTLVVEEAKPAPATEPVGIVVEEPTAPQTSAPEQPTAPPPAQEPAQAAAPAPAAPKQKPEPPAAAEKAAAASPQVSTDVSEDVADLLAQWQ